MCCVLRAVLFQEEELAELDARLQEVSPVLCAVCAMSRMCDVLLCHMGCRASSVQRDAVVPMWWCAKGCCASAYPRVAG
jgi:hypothetical protein